MLSLTQSDPHCYQLDHNTRVYFAIALLINGGVNNWMNCLWKIFGQRRVGGGGVRGNVRGEMSRYRPGMAQEKSGHPIVYMYIIIMYECLYAYIHENYINICMFVYIHACMCTNIHI